jgi:hypothetical protein
MQSWVRSGRDARRGSIELLGPCILVLVGIFLFMPRAWGQGCIIAHSFGEVGGPTTQGGYLQPGHWELTIGYRHQYSFRHYVGSVEQTYRAQTHSEVRNRINLVSADLTYQITRRWSADIDAPFEFASRRYFIGQGVFGNNIPAQSIIGDYGTQGLGDITMSVHRWMWDPKDNPKHNIELGIGIEFPTGQDSIASRFSTRPGAPPTDNIADYSIQPGIGVWGLPISWVSFQSLNSQVQVYFNGSYLATLQESNGVPTGHSDPLTAYVSPGDEYLLQAGISYSFKSIRGLAFTFGPRDEGVRSHDFFTRNIGWRRPGFAISLEPGFQYLFNHGNDLITGSIARAIYRNRTRSVPDIIEGTHGDAAFADYVWLASFVHRF